MSKSKAQKIRAHRVRNGKRNPEFNRITNPDFSTHERKLPTLTEKRIKQARKYNHLGG